MGFLDMVILAVLAIGAWKGWVSGLLRQVASLIGFFLGLFLASSLYDSLGSFLTPHLGTSASVACVLAFLMIWVGVPLLLSILAALLSRLLDSAHLGKVNCFAGACVGVLKYAIALSCVLNVMSMTHVVTLEKQQESLLFTPVKSLVGMLFDTYQKHKIQDPPAADTTTVGNDADDENIDEAEE